MSILITGAHGFLGKHLCQLLKSNYEILTPTHRDLDLIDQRSVRDYLSLIRPTEVIHLAGNVGGIGYNKENPGKLFYENIQMGINLIETCRIEKVNKILIVGTVCSYPKFTPVPFLEDHIWNGYPEETNAPYGIAKKALLVMAQSYREQYGLNIVYIIPTNLYGPGDDFSTRKSHVIPALIRKVIEAKRLSKTSIDLWGTGSATRDFLYVEDAARGISKALEIYNSIGPINLGSGTEVSILNLLIFIKDIVGYEGQVLLDTSKPDGQPRRYLNTSRAEGLLNWRASTELREGLKRTIEWYENQIES